MGWANWDDAWAARAPQDLRDWVETHRPHAVWVEMSALGWRMIECRTCGTGLDLTEAE